VTALDIFTYADQQVRTVLVDGEPWFVLADLCAVLDLTNPSMVSARLDPTGLNTLRLTEGIRGNPNVTIVNESNMYEVVIRSDKAEAVTFRRWITGKVLPAIRKTGTFSAVAAVETAEQLLARALTVASGVIAAKDSRIAELEPIAAESMTYRQSAGLRSIQDLANDLRTHALATLPSVRILQDDVFDQAGRLGLIIRGNTVRHNQPTAQAINAGWVKPARKEIEHNSGATSTKVYARLTPKGGARLWDGCLAYISEHGTLAMQKAVA
jgi:anti-repressor protein